MDLDIRGLFVLIFVSIIIIVIDYLQEKRSKEMHDKVSKETRKKWNDKFSIIEDSMLAGTFEPNEWETDFLDSVIKTLHLNKDLTMRQSICLNKIYEKCL